MASIMQASRQKASSAVVWWKRCREMTPCPDRQTERMRASLADSWGAHREKRLVH